MSNNKKTKIAIAGIGGIGGYIAGKLAHFYPAGGNIEIVFIARGETLQVLGKQGLKLISNNTVYQCTPALTSDDPLEIGPIHILVICTKSYDTVDVLKKYGTCLTENTTVITTQNTVSAKAGILPYLPEGATLLEGCIYIASNISKPGLVNHVSGPSKLYFGTNGEFYEQAEIVLQLFREAGIDATYTTAIEPVLWKKYMFVSPAAAVTALFQIPFSQIKKNEEAAQLFAALVNELMQLATAKNIVVDADTVSNNLSLLDKFEGNIKSSFQLDLEYKKPTEINTLVNYVIQEAAIYHVPVPNFEHTMLRLSEKYKNLGVTALNESR